MLQIMYSCVYYKTSSSKLKSNIRLKLGMIYSDFIKRLGSLHDNTNMF